MRIAGQQGFLGYFVGILLFSVVSWRDFRVNREIHEHLPNKYFMWSAIRLDTDPANRRKWEFGICKEGERNCVTWDLKDTWVDPGVLDGFLLLTAFPAFVVGRLTAGILGTMGINQHTTFMLSMPVLLCFGNTSLVGYSTAGCT